MELKEIVPEYHSKNIFVKNLFLKRIKLAIQLAKIKLESNSNLRVIDLGCGEGILLRLLEKNFKNIKTFGLDIRPKVLEIKNFLRANIKVADLRKSGFPNDFFDIIFCLDTLEHFKNLEEPTREIKRIIKPNGLLIISLPTENLLYKLGRFLVKGTTSEEGGPCSSPHFHRAGEIERFLLSQRVIITKIISLPRFLPLFHVMSLRKNQLKNFSREYATTSFSNHSLPE